MLQLLEVKTPNKIITMGDDMLFFTKVNITLTWIIVSYLVFKERMTKWDNKDETGRIDSNAYVTSKYVDYQSRITQNLFGTFGARFDEHSLAGDGSVNSHEVTLAYVFDGKGTKLKSSYGTGYRFPSLYEMLYVWNSRNNCNFGGANCADVGFKKSRN